MRILTTHKKKNHDLWLRHVDVLAGWEKEFAARCSKDRSRLWLLYHDLKWAFVLFRTSREYDVVVTGSERPSLIFGLMQMFGRRRRVPHLLLECMWDFPVNRLAFLRRRLLLKWVATSTERIVVYARRQIDEYAKTLRVPAEKFVFIPSHTTLYGKAYRATSGNYIFSGGCTNRDYATLLEAVRCVPCRTIICVASEGTLAGHDVPGNVEVLVAVPEDRFYQLMAESAFVVVSLVGGKLERGGRQVYENAMAMGKGVIVSDDLADDYITDGVTGLLVCPGDPLKLRQAILTLLEDRRLTDELGVRAMAASAEYTPERFFERVFTLVTEFVHTERKCVAANRWNPFSRQHTNTLLRQNVERCERRDHDL